MIGSNQLVQGSGGSGDVSITSNDPNQDKTKIDLGNRGPGSGDSLDLKNNTGSVSTTDPIRDAGGPTGVLVDSQEQAKEVNKAVGKVTAEITTTDTSNDDSANGPSGILPENTPSPSPSSMPTNFDLPGGKKAVVAVAAAVAVFLFGGL